MRTVYAKRAALILVAVVLVAEGYFVYRWYDRYSGPSSGAASGGAASLEETRLDRTVAKETTEGRDAPPDVAGRDVVDPQQDEAEYVGAVGDIQAEAVETFLENHEKLLRYDALAADDVEEMETYEAALQELEDRAANLAPPQKYGEQHEVFASAIVELRAAAGLAHDMAADPVAAAELGFDEYDRRVERASDLLRRSNEMLGKDYEAIEDVRETSPEF